MTRTATVLAAFLLVGCATHPSDIPPMQVSKVPYRDLSCAELQHELRVATEQRDTYVRRQKSNRTRDGLLNTFVLIGSGALTSDHEDEVAKAKGAVLAIEGEIAARCPARR